MCQDERCRHPYTCDCPEQCADKASDPCFRCGHDVGEHDESCCKGGEDILCRCDCFESSVEPEEPNAHVAKPIRDVLNAFLNTVATESINGGSE